MAKRFTQAEREKAVAKAQESGDYDKVASELGIKKATLKKWERDMEYDDDLDIDFDDDGNQTSSRSKEEEQSQVPSGVQSYMFFSGVIVAVIVGFSVPIGDLVSEDSSLLKHILASALAGALIVYGISYPYLRIKYGHRDSFIEGVIVFILSLWLLILIMSSIFPSANFWRVCQFSMILSLIVAFTYPMWFYKDEEE